MSRRQNGLRVPRSLSPRRFSTQPFLAGKAGSTPKFNWKRSPVASICCGRKSRLVSQSQNPSSVSSAAFETRNSSSVTVSFKVRHQRTGGSQNVIFILNSTTRGEPSPNTPEPKPTRRLSGWLPAVPFALPKTDGVPAVLNTPLIEFLGGS